MINRCVVTVRRKAPFVYWLKKLPDLTNIIPEELDQDSTAYLLPDYDSDSDKEKLLQQFYDLIFEEELLGWWTVKEDWPQPRTYEIFKEWFECEFHSIVLDLVDDTLVDE